jgi:hypothetical protein
VEAQLVATVGIEGRALHVVRQPFAITLTDHPHPTLVHSGWQMRPDQARALAAALLAAVDDDGGGGADRESAR